MSIDTGWGNRIGEGIACGVERDGSVTCWGREYEFAWQGIATTEGPFADISVGGYVCGLRTNGSVSCWGQFRDAAEIPEGAFSSVSVGDGHACGVRTDGSVQCWGDDQAGQAYSPPGLFASVSASYRFSCGLKTDGSAMCWGDTSPR